MIDWQWCTFDQLTNTALYQVLATRQAVFVLEQRCLYPDIDDFDQQAWHLIGWQTIDGRRQLAAYLRCFGPGIKYAELSLGRVLTAPHARAGGIGRQLLEQGIAHAVRQFPGHAIRIAAQQYLERFYGGYGFVTVTAPYDEDGIAHVDMLRAA